MNSRISTLFFFILLFYPLFSYGVFKLLNSNPDFVFGILCLLFLLFQIAEIYRKNSNFRLPLYVIVFAAFTVYTILSSIFVSDLFYEIGAVKYLYSSPYIMTLWALLIVENTEFHQKTLKIGLNVIFATVLCSTIAIIIQVFNPLFLYKKDEMLEGLSYDRISGFYAEHSDEMKRGVNRFLKGYRYSIYSYIDKLSVGIDGLALFSIVFAVRTNNWLKKNVLLFSSAIMAFLTSSRWIMLNFIVISSQIIWVSKNKLLNFLKYLLYGLSIVIIVVVVAYFSGIDIQKFIDNRLMSSSANTRILAFEVFFKVFPENMFFGTGGVDTAEVEMLLRGRSSQIHVGYLKLFYYYGIIGGTLYLTFLVLLLRRLWRMAKYSNYWGGFFALLGFAVANLTLVRLHLFYFGLILGLIYSRYYFNLERDNAPAILLNTEIE